MSLLRQLARGIRGLTHRSAAEKDVADEVDDYFSHLVDAHLARGLTPQEARRAARVELGNATAVKEQVREYGWQHGVETFAADVRYAARGLRASPGFAAIVILTLAIGMGATTAIFSAVKPILLEPLAYPNPDRVVVIQELGRSGVRIDGTFGMYHWMRERNRVFDAVAIVKEWQPTVTGTGEPERLEGQRVSADYFKVLGVQPAFGPGFRQSDDVRNGPNVVILSHGLWARRFSSDPAIVGRQVTLEDDSYTVAGVMPAHFSNVMAPAAEVWSLLQYDLSQGRAWGHHLRTVGRLRSEVDVTDASRQIDALGQAALAELKPPSYGAGVTFAVYSLGDEITRGVKPMLLTVTAAVFLVLLIACANVTNLLLARNARRRGEFAVRVALGAGGRRLLRLLLAESFLLGSIGGLLGMAVAWLGVRGLVSLSPLGVPRLDAIRVDVDVFLFGVAVTALLSVITGAVPALQVARSDPQEFLRGHRLAPPSDRRLRRGLVVAEMAFAMMLLVGSSLLFFSLQRLFAVPVGFDSSHLLTVEVQTVGPSLREPGAATRFFEQVVRTVQDTPGVVNAAFVSQLPLAGGRDEYGVRFEVDITEGAESHGLSSFRYAVSSEYLQTLRLPLVAGRGLTIDDHDGAPKVALISEALARQRFGSPTEAVGHRLRIGATSSEPYLVIGVVGDVKQVSLALSQSEAVYTTARQWQAEERAMTLVVRTAGDPVSLAPAIRQAIWAVDRNQPIGRVETMQALLDATGGERGFALILFESFALVALILSAAGCYGVLAGYVAERTREIGVRSVLGAGPAEIVAQVVRQGLALVAPGVALGLVGSLFASQALTTLLFGLTRLDPLAYAVAAGVLLIVSIVASGIPAWRAAQIDPAVTLKTG